MKSILRSAVGISAAALALLPGTAMAGYQIGEGTPLGAAASPAAAGGTVGAGPIRLARFSFVQGNVTWREGDGAAWSPASVNLPIRQGAQVWVADGGRAEVQFDDGSLLRLGNGAVVTLQTLYSDQNGEFTELKLSEGLSALELRGTESIYQIDTPFVSVKSEGPSKVRVGVDSSVEVAVRLGKATVEGNGTKTTLSNGDYLDLNDGASVYNVNPLPDEDSWDRFNDDRDQQLADAESDHRLPSDIALVAGNLDAYGSWHDDPRYGPVWCPRETDADWRPYQHGHWVWVEPFGWTWVGDEAWGWAPYHYGTWVSEPYGWGWVPGPARQYWCPAVVHFSEYGGGIAWAPLAPGEVRYPPTLALGFRGGNWAAFFSIGGAAVYYPHNNDYCEPRPFNNATVNRITYVNNGTNIYNRPSYNNGFSSTTVNRNLYLHGSGFVPVNARSGSGVTTASTAEFGGGGHYHPQTFGGAAYWTRGRSVGAPQAGFAPVAGPMSVHPTLLGATASRSFVPDAHPNPFFQDRSTFRAPLPNRVARFAPPLRSPSSGAARFPSPPSVRSGAMRLNPGTAGSAVGWNNDFRPGDQDRQTTLRARQDISLPADGFRKPDPGPMRIALPRENSSPGETGVPREDRYRMMPRQDRGPLAPRFPDRAETRTYTYNSAENNRAENRSQPRSENRPQEQRPQEQRPQEQRPQEQRPQEQRPQEQRPQEQRPQEQRPQRSSDQSDKGRSDNKDKSDNKAQSSKQDQNGERGGRDDGGHDGGGGGRGRR